MRLCRFQARRRHLLASAGRTEARVPREGGEMPRSAAVRAAARVCWWCAANGKGAVAGGYTPCGESPCRQNVKRGEMLFGRRGVRRGEALPLQRSPCPSAVKCGMVEL